MLRQVPLGVFLFGQLFTVLITEIETKRKADATFNYGVEGPPSLEKIDLLSTYSPIH